MRVNFSCLLSRTRRGGVILPLVGGGDTLVLAFEVMAVKFVVVLWWGVEATVCRPNSLYISLESL